MFLHCLLQTPLPQKSSFSLLFWRLIFWASNSGVLPHSASSHHHMVICSSAKDWNFMEVRNLHPGYKSSPAWPQCNMHNSKYLKEKKISQFISPKGPKGIFTGSLDAEAPTLWPPDKKNQLTGKDPDAGKEWRQKEKEVREDEMVR